MHSDIAVAHELPQAANAGLGKQSLPVYRAICCCNMRKVRARPDKAHMACQDGQKLRQLIKPVSPQEFSCCGSQEGVVRA